VADKMISEEVLLRIYRELGALNVEPEEYAGTHQRKSHQERVYRNVNRAREELRRAWNLVYRPTDITMEVEEPG